jgi:hypothetical protein
MYRRGDSNDPQLYFLAADNGGPHDLGYSWILRRRIPLDEHNLGLKLRLSAEFDQYPLESLQLREEPASVVIVSRNDDDR